MSIVRKWACARFEHIDPDDMGCWIAECRAGTGTWVIVQRETSQIIGMMVDFPDEEGLLLDMTREQRDELGMSDAVYHALNVGLELDRERREDPRAESSARAAVVDLRHQLADIESRLAAVEEKA